MVYGLWFMVYDLWFTVYGLWFTAYGLWFMVYDLRFIIGCIRFRVYGVGYISTKIGDKRRMSRVNLLLRSLQPSFALASTLFCARFNPLLRSLQPSFALASTLFCARFTRFKPRTLHVRRCAALRGGVLQLSDQQGGVDARVQAHQPGVRHVPGRVITNTDNSSGHDYQVKPKL